MQEDIARFANECFIASVESPSFGASYAVPMCLLNGILPAVGHYDRRCNMQLLKKAAGTTCGAGTCCAEMAKAGTDNTKKASCKGYVPACKNLQGRLSILTQPTLESEPSESGQGREA